MTPTKPRLIADRPERVHPVVFSHPADEIRSAPRQLRGTSVLRFESSAPARW